MGFFGGTAECGYIKMGWGWRSSIFWSRYDCRLAVYGLMDGRMNGRGVLVGFIWAVLVELSREAWMDGWMIIVVRLWWGRSFVNVWFGFLVVGGLFFSGLSFFAGCADTPLAKPVFYVYLLGYGWVAGKQEWMGKGQGIGILSGFDADAICISGIIQLLDCGWPMCT